MDTICAVPFNPLALPIAPSHLVWTTTRPTDFLDFELITRRVAKAMEPQENALDFIKACTLDITPIPEWNILEFRFDEIRQKPGCSHAFRWLLRRVARFCPDYSSRFFPNPGLDLITRKLYEMIDRIANRALLELDLYDQREENASRPADIYRAYGLALRYAAEDLGSFQACDALSRLMLASPLPVDELENPDWIDPYTGEADSEYVQIRVKEPTSEVSGDGNLPQMIADLLANMDKEEASAFEEMLKIRGSSLDDYWAQFKEAQRSGYSDLAEPEDEQDEPEFDVIEKDFQFSEDLKVNFENVAELQKLLMLQLDALRQFVRAAAEQASKCFALGQGFDFKFLHQKFLKYPATRALIEQMTKLACTKKYLPRDLMAVLLPFQNSFAFWEDDLYLIRIPYDSGYTMAHWYQIHGDDYLEQFLAKEEVDYGDPQVNRQVGKIRFIPREEPGPADLDEFTWKVVFEQTDRYNKCEERRVLWAAEKRWPALIQKYMKTYLVERFLYSDAPLHGNMPMFRPVEYKPDAKWHPAYVTAEVETAILGEGGSTSAQAAGWNAWRDSIDPDANRTYQFHRRHGMNHAEAMNKFWEVVKSNRNRIKSVNQKGVILQSGRQIDWGIFLLKLKANEISMTINEMSRFLDEFLLKRKWGTPTLRVYLVERVRGEMAQLAPCK